MKGIYLGGTVPVRIIYSIVLSHGYTPLLYDSPPSYRIPRSKGPKNLFVLYICVPYICMCICPLYFVWHTIYDPPYHPPPPYCPPPILSGRPGACRLYCPVNFCSATMAPKKYVKFGPVANFPDNRREGAVVAPGPTDRMVIDVDAQVDAQVPEVAPHKKPKRVLSFATKKMKSLSTGLPTQWPKHVPSFLK